MNCITCTYAGTATDIDGNPLMECHRFPPQIMWRGDHAELIQAYPTVREDDWCGEYREEET